MPDMSQNGGNSFSKLKDLMGKMSPQSFMKSIPSPIQSFKKIKQERELTKQKSEIDKREATLTTKETKSKEKIKAARIAALRKLYKVMQDAGVDPNDLQSIAAFREKLMAEDPDLAELFFNAFDALTQGLEDGEEPAQQPDLMTQATTNLQQQPGMMR